MEQMLADLLREYLQWNGIIAYAFIMMVFIVDDMRINLFGFKWYVYLCPALFVLLAVIPFFFFQREPMYDDQYKRRSNTVRVFRKTYMATTKGITIYRYTVAPIGNLFMRKNALPDDRYRHIYLYVANFTEDDCVCIAGRKPYTASRFMMVVLLLDEDEYAHDMQYMHRYPSRRYGHYVSKHVSREKTPDIVECIEFDLNDYEVKMLPKISSRIPD